MLRYVPIVLLSIVFLVALPAAAQPSINQLQPMNGAVGVSALSKVVITFDTPMDPSSLTGQSGFGPCSGSIQISRDNFTTCLPASTSTAVMSNANTTATMTPAPALAFGITYKVRVLGTVRSAMLEPMGSTVTQSNGFLTATDVIRPAHVNISQVYGGGGNTGAPYTNDFVELHNPRSVAVSVGGYGIQYASATGTTWLVHALPNVILPAGAYYLIQLGSGGVMGTPLPAPDFVPSVPVQMSSTGGKVALTLTTTPLVTACPIGGTIVDFVGYGATANCFEGMGPTGTTSNLLGAVRLVCGDTDNNSADFSVMTPFPRNSLSPPLMCADSAANETGSMLEINYCNLQFPLSVSIPAGGTSPTIYAQVYHAGYTEGPGPSSILAQIGYGSSFANPQNESGYFWTNASFNVQSGNNDEYQATFTVPMPGSYRYTARFSLDGASWTYCDTDGAGSNVSLDFSPALLGVMTVTSSPSGGRRTQVTSVD